MGLREQVEVRPGRMKAPPLAPMGLLPACASRDRGMGTGGRSERVRMRLETGSVL
jgi:hypothetical protein